MVVQKLSLSVVLSLFFFVYSAAQDSLVEVKVDPFLRDLIAKSKTQKIASKKRCFFRKKKSTSDETGAIDVKKYDCIVYTRNAPALRNMGIIINSELSTFVTAKATLRQIIEMAKMKDVTYIASPSLDTPQNSFPE